MADQNALMMINPFEALETGRKRAYAGYEAGQAAAQREALNELYAQATDPRTGEVNMNALYAGLAQRRMGAAIPGMQQAQADIAFKQAQAAKQLQDADTAFWTQSRAELATLRPGDRIGYQSWANRVIQRAPWAAEYIAPELTPETQRQMLMTADAALPKGTTTEVGGVIVTTDPYTGKEIGKVDYSAAEQAARRAGRQQTQITNLPAKLESAESTEKGKLNVEIYKGIRDSAINARRLQPKLQTVRQKLDEGFETGFLAPIKKEAASFLTSIGVSDAEKYATDAQTFFAAAQERVLERQLEQKGVQTTSDAQRMTQTFAQLGNTPKANRFLVDIAEAQGKRDIETQKFYDKWWNENGTYEGAEEAWLFGTPNELEGVVSSELAKMAGRGSKSLFDDPLLKKYAPTEAPSIVKVKSVEEARKLPPGTKYQTPSGKVFTRKRD